MKKTQGSRKAPGKNPGLARVAFIEVAFTKVEGAGNDFVLLEAGTGGISPISRAQIRQLLDRHRGVGGDGLLLLETGRGVPRVRYWNSDGGQAAFCGNGARCVANFLLTRAEMKISRTGGASRGERKRNGRGGEANTPQGEVEFDFGRRRLRARRAEAGRVALLLPEPRSLPLPKTAPPLPAAAKGEPLWIDSGVPHWVVPVSGLDAVDLGALAPEIRSWAPLGPAGTNVDLIEHRGRVLHVRTWERGVEGETLACGSGLMASAWYGILALGLALPLRLRSRGGDAFLLSRDESDAGLWLEGPARIVFCGTAGVPAGSALSAGSVRSAPPAGSARSALSAGSARQARSARPAPPLVPRSQKG